MIIKELAFRVEELQHKAFVIDSVQTAVCAGLYQGGCPKESCEWAFMELGKQTSELSAALEALTDDLFAAFQQADV